MQIHSIFAGHSDPAPLGRGTETGQPLGGRPPDAAESPAAAPGAATAVAEILSRYDVVDISPAEFSAMIQKLYDAGAISERELQQLAAVRLDLDGDGVESDESIDLLEFYADKIQKIQRRLSDSDDQPIGSQQLGPLLERLDWIEKFALIQSAPDAIGLDALA